MAGRLHTVLRELVPGGVSKRITAGQAAQVLESITPAGAVAAAHRELAFAFIEDLARIDAQMRHTKKKLTAVVAAAGTTITEVFGIGPVIVAVIIGGVAPSPAFRTAIASRDVSDSSEGGEFTQ